MLAVVFFGSRKTKASPDAWSAYDFFVITRGYPEFYRCLRKAGAFRRSPVLAAALNVVLPPNQVSVRATGPDGAPLFAKCAVVSLGAFLRETSPRRHDHFFLGRLFQPTEVLYAADEAMGQRILDALLRAHVLTLAWMRPWLPEPFDVAAYCRTALGVSFAAEIRPEPSRRVEALWQAQQDELRVVYGALLRELAEAGDLVERGPGAYALARRVSRLERARLAGYFRWSLVRATARWAKHILTFDDWLDFILRKARRHTGEEIVLSPRERRMPLLFLWPRLFRYLRHKDR